MEQKSREGGLCWRPGQSEGLLGVAGAGELGDLGETTEGSMAGTFSSVRAKGRKSVGGPWVMISY